MEKSATTRKTSRAQRYWDWLVIIAVLSSFAGVWWLIVSFNWWVLLAMVLIVVGGSLVGIRITAAEERRLGADPDRWYESTLADSIIQQEEQKPITHRVNPFL